MVAHTVLLLYSEFLEPLGPDRADGNQSDRNWFNLPVKTHFNFQGTLKLHIERDQTETDPNSNHKPVGNINLEDRIIQIQLNTFIYIHTLKSMFATADDFKQHWGRNRLSAVAIDSKSNTKPLFESKKEEEEEEDETHRKIKHLFPPFTSQKQNNLFLKRHFSFLV